VARLRASWEQLNLDITSVQAHLKGILAKWEDFGESQARLEKWLSDTETALTETADSKGELGEIKTTLERVKNLTSEIESKGIVFRYNLK